MFFDDAVLAAITTDSRQYNVFTFLEDDATSEDGGAALAGATSSDDLPAPPGPTRTQVEPGDPVVAAQPAVDTRTGPLSSSPAEQTKEVTQEKDVEPLDLKVDSINLQASCPPTAKRKIIPNTADLDLTLSPASSLPDLYEFDGQRTPDDVDDPVLDDFDHNLTEDVLSNSVFGSDLDWEDSADSVPVEPIPEYTAREEFEDNKKWRMVRISDRTYRIDMEAIAQYKKVLSHGGYFGNGLNAIVVFTACYLPEKSMPGYHYIMDNLFLYVMSTLELLVVQEYMIVYFHSATTRRKLPGLRWFRRCYDMIDHRLRKNLRGLLVVHPSLLLKTIMLMMKPFVSSKFSAKLRYVNSLADLTHAVPTEYMFIPDEVIQFDNAVNRLRAHAAPV